MLYYSCDSCKRMIDPQDELRYVVRMEVYAAAENSLADDEDGADRDHLEEVQEILRRLGDDDRAPLDDDVYQQLRFDLCPACRKKFLENPLARAPSKQFDFSEN